MLKGQVYFLKTIVSFNDREEKFMINAALKKYIVKHTKQNF